MGLWLSPVEHRPCKAGAPGSNPGGSIECSYCVWHSSEERRRNVCISFMRLNMNVFISTWNKFICFNVKNKNLFGNLLSRRLIFIDYLWKIIYYVDDLACVAKKGVVSCDIPWVGAYFLWTMGSWIGLPNYSHRRRHYSGNWNILVPDGKEINWDLVSNGEWNPVRSNWICYSNIMEMWCEPISRLI